MRSLSPHVLGALLILAGSNAVAGVIQHEGVVFTSSYTGNVLTLKIDAAQRSGGWASAVAIDAIGIKPDSKYTGVSLTANTGAGAWSLNTAELNADGCASAAGNGASKGNGKDKQKAATTAAGKGETRLCYSGTPVRLADGMLFTFSFTGAPDLTTPHLKVHFVDSFSAKTGSLLSLDFPADNGVDQGGGASTGAPAPAPVPAPVPAPTPAPAPVLVPIVEPVPVENPAPVLPPIIDPVLIPVTEGGGGAKDVAAPVLVDTPDQAADVPEPQSVLLIGAGLALLGLMRRRKARA